MKNLEYSRVKKGYEPLEPRTRLLATHEILRASATLHLSSTVSLTKLGLHIDAQYSKCGLT